MGNAPSGENDRTAVSTEISADEASHAAALVGGAGKMCSQLHMSISAAGLHNKDKASLSDPFVVAYVAESSTGAWECLGRTEIVSNTLNPSFVKLLSVTFKFETYQRMRFEVYDADSSYKSADASALILQKQDFQGYAETVLAEIVGQINQTWSAPLTKIKDGKQLTGDRGTITVTVEEVAQTNDMVNLELSAGGLDDLDKGFGKSDPFIVISRMQDGNNVAPTRCFRTEIRKNDLHPKFNPFSISLAVLSGGDVNRSLLLECYHYRKKGDHKLIGSASLSVTNMMKYCTDKSPITLVNPKKAAKKGDKYQGSGSLYVTKIEVIQRPTFFEYVTSGCKLSFVPAIDYTGSNGPPAHPRSLHYSDGPHNPTQYAQAIEGLGRILEFYDSTNRYPVYGFGGVPPGQSMANHCFAVNGNEMQPEVNGVQGILTSYYNSLNVVNLSGPTLFAPVINHTGALAASTVTTNPYYQRYWVLLIITDGLITDMSHTVDAIVACSGLPMSIIIVGVGEADYSAMRQLDADDARLRSSQGVVASRDIVQFVPMRDFLNQPEALAKEVLAELPEQLVQYMQRKGIMPVPAHGKPHAVAPVPVPQPSVAFMQLSSSLPPGSASAPLPPP